MRNSTVKNGFFILGIITVLIILYFASPVIGNQNKKINKNENNQITLLHNLIEGNQEKDNQEDALKNKYKSNETTESIESAESIESTIKEEENDVSKETPKENSEDTISEDTDEHSYDNYLILVNKENPLSEGYLPPDLIQPNIPFNFSEDSPKKQMRQKAAQALERMFAKAKEENIPLVAQSGYRSYQTQEAIFTYNQSRYGFEEANNVSAVAGQSEHQTGLAMDVTDPSLSPDPLVVAFGETESGIWLAENAAQFGFIIRYPEGKEHITGYQYEPWHIRYVGEEAALTIKNNHWTLEEFWQNQKK